MPTQRRRRNGLRQGRAPCRRAKSWQGLPQRSTDVIQWRSCWLTRTPAADQHPRELRMSHQRLQQEFQCAAAPDVTGPGDVTVVADAPVCARQEVALLTELSRRVPAWG